MTILTFWYLVCVK